MKKTLCFVTVLGLLIVFVSLVRPHRNHDTGTQEAGAQEFGNFGKLILQGRYIPSPYQIAGSQHEITVNGHAISRTETTPPMEDASPGVAVAYETVQEFWDIYHSALELVPRETAIASGVEYLKGQACVDEVKQLSDSYLVIQFLDSFPLSLNLAQVKHNPDWTPPGDISQKLNKLNISTKFLDTLPSRIHGWLNNGHLLIMAGPGCYRTYPHPESEEVFDRLCNTVRTIDDFETRVAAIREIVGVPILARDIAENLADTIP